MNGKRLRVTFVVTGLLALLLAAPAWAVITTWTDATPDNWSTAGSWDNGAPTANDTAVFDGTGAGACTIDGAAVCNRLVISEATQSITIAAGQSLAVGVGGFSFTDGDFADAGEAVTVAGTCRIVDPAALVSTGTWTISNTGNIENATAGNIIGTLVISNGAPTIIKVTRAAAVYAKAVSIGAGDSLLGAFALHLLPVVDDFIAIAADGGIAGGTSSVVLTANQSLAAVGLGESVQIDAGSSDDTLTLAGNFSAYGATFGPSLTVKDGGYGVTSYGNLIISDTATVVASTGAWTMSVSGNIKNSAAANAFNSLTIGGSPGIVATRVGNVACKKFEAYPGDSLKGAYTLYVIPATSYFLSVGTANTGVVVGGATDVYLTASLIQDSAVVEEPLTIHGTSKADTLTMSSYLGATGLTIGDSLTFVDSGYAISSVGDLVVGDSVLIKSTGVWSQTLQGDAVNATAGNAFYAYVATATVDTVFFNPAATNDTFAVSGIFLVTGTRGETVLCGKASGTSMLFPTNAYASDAAVLNLHSADRQVLKAYACRPSGHNSGVAFSN